MEINIKTYDNSSDELLDIMSNLEHSIFEKPYPRSKLARELSTKHNLVALVAFSSEGPCAFKVGYELNARQYYSWIGGVVNDYRGKGIAKNLMVLQHKLVKSMGFQSVRTDTENQFREMLVLNIKFGFDVIGVNRGRDAKTIIMLEKLLT